MSQEVVNLYGMQKVKKLSSNQDWARINIKPCSEKPEDHKNIRGMSVRGLLIKLRILKVHGWTIRKNINIIEKILI